MRAASFGPRQLRSAGKMKPRNRTSSHTGASAHVRAALSSSRATLSPVPSCSSSFSLGALNAADQLALKARNATTVAATRRTDLHRRVLRSPNCAALPLRQPSCAKNTAATTNPTS